MHETARKDIPEGDGRVLYRAAFLGGNGEGGELKEVEYESVETALMHACRDLRAGYKPIGIWTQDRALLYGAAAIRAHCAS